MSNLYCDECEFYDAVFGDCNAGSYTECPHPQYESYDDDDYAFVHYEEDYLDELFDEDCDDDDGDL